MVTRNAMMRTGTARRRAGSATRRRRYAGLAIDCARPLIESVPADALARAGAMPGLPIEDCPRHPRVGQDVPHLRPNHFDLNRLANLCRESRESISKNLLRSPPMRRK